MKSNLPFYLLSVNLPYLATEFMLNTLRVNSSTHNISLTWEHPYYLPLYYEQKAKCVHWCSDQWLFTPKRTLSASLTSSVLLDLQPATQCIITFKAIYNPASLDPGIIKVVYTLSNSEHIVE